MGTKNKLRKEIIKQKIKDTPKGTWIFLAVMGFFVIVSIALIIIAMHISGYNLLTFIRKFYAWFLLVAVAVVLLVLFLLFNKYRRGK